MKTLKKGITTLLIVGMVITALPTNVQAAKKSKIKISKKKLTMYVGGTKTLKLKGTKKTPKWTSSKKSVATVTKKGKIKAKKKGTTVITAKLGKKKYSCKVTVKQRFQSGNKPATQTSSVPPTQNPAVTPTKQPGATPTNKPGDNTVVANNYQTLANYLRRSGKYNVDNEYYYISKLQHTNNGDDVFTTIRYNADGSFEFGIVYVSEYGTDMVILTVTPPEYGKGVADTMFEASSSSSNFIYISGEIDLSSLSKTNHSVPYTYTNVTNEELLESLCIIGESDLGLGLAIWSDMLEETQLGLTLKDLGFTSYER